MRYMRTAVLTVLLLAATVIAPPEASAAQPTWKWKRLAQCESHGEWDYGPHSTWGSKKYHGGLQFHPRTWLAYRAPDMPRYAYQADAIQQVWVAEKVLARQGWRAWPHCSRKLGYR